MLRYFIEIRRRLIYCAILFASFFAIFCYFANPLYHWLALPLLQSLPVGHTLITTSVTASFLVPLKWAAMLAIFCMIPIIFYHVWAFVMPALYPQERRWLWPLLLLSVLLFYSGMTFAYEIVFPLVFRFLIQSAPAGVSVLPDMSHYLDIVWQLFFAFGVAFEVPVITVLLIRMKLISIASLRAKRPYIIVGAFIIGMLLTPPDVVSQVLLAVPLWLLFEIGILLACL